ncbi:hypothetical protein [Mariniluteicoccus endophyticus]
MSDSDQNDWIKTLVSDAWGLVELLETDRLAAIEMAEKHYDQPGLLLALGSLVQAMRRRARPPLE